MATLRDKNQRNDMRHQLYDDLATSGVDIAKFVKTMRKVLGQDQIEFCKTVGVGLATLRKIEQKNGNITLESLEKILKKFAVRLVVKK